MRHADETIERAIPAVTPAARADDQADDALVAFDPDLRVVGWNSGTVALYAFLQKMRSASGSQTSSFAIRTSLSRSSA